MTDTTPASCRTHLTDAEVAKLTAERDEARVDRDDYALRLKNTAASWAKLAAERDRLRADLARAQELIAELRDVAERADRAFARYDTGGGETPPDPGSVPRAQGVAVDGPEIAVDGQTPVTGSRGMGRDANGAQNATQAGVWEDRSPRCAHCGCPRTHHDRADGGCNGDFLTCTCRAYVPAVRVEG